MPESSDTDSVSDDSEYDIDSFATINLLHGLDEGKTRSYSAKNDLVSDICLTTVSLLYFFFFSSSFSFSRRRSPLGLLGATDNLQQRLPTEDQLRRSLSQDYTPSAVRQTSTHVLTVKRSVRKLLPVRSGISVKMRTTNASMADKVITMSVDLENEESSGCPFEIEKVEVQVANAVISLAFTKEVRNITVRHIFTSFLESDTLLRIEHLPDNLRNP